MESRYLIIRVEPYMGRDTFINCGTIKENFETVETPIYSVVNAQTGFLLDSGYRNFEEAAEVWKEAINAKTPL